MTDRIRALREIRGLTQESLAARAGLTRQQIGAMEARRHVPNVAAALAVAEALGTTVEQLFGDDSSTAVPVTGTFTGGAAVRAGRVGEQLVTDGATAPTATAERWALADGIAADGDIALFPGALPASLVVAGCDPLLGSLGEVVERSSRHRVLVVHASSRDAVDALAAGRAHAAVVHGPAGSLSPPADLAVRRWRVAQWQAGLAASGRVAPSLDELGSRRARVVQRESGAATQDALERALTAAGVGSLPGPVADGHLDVARRIRSRQARAGITMEAAALAFGLSFAPFEVHDVELWVPERWGHVPAIDALLHVLRDEAFARRAATVPGYELAGIGTELRPAV